MSKLNAPRTIPYEFRVFELDEWVWLYDESERTYICSAVPMIFAEPLYTLSEDGDDSPPDGDYFSETTVRAQKNVGIKLDREWTAPEVPYREAWENAFEEASINRRI